MLIPTACNSGKSRVKMEKAILQTNSDQYFQYFSQKYLWLLLRFTFLKSLFHSSKEKKVTMRKEQPN